ncbi:HPr family phosphocarrier protein [Actinomadura sp. GC306]|uniref:HPr family phosphocarrier protein n=1 Tax=Actinomadura sp. GC306 TaxID=2530367 RepID=UPI0010487063|nr:HPr family phosphocarrier protein [Actinomadura sp. GC306]TDC64873.1 HPr family phosphocarrier protein [Actinomadura sp. GC306]
MPERKVIIGSAQGLHARPAKIFVQRAAQQPVPVSIRTGDRAPVPASSILGVLSLGAGQGAEVVLSADGDGADAVLDELAALLAGDLDADEPGHG